MQELPAGRPCRYWQQSPHESILPEVLCTGCSIHHRPHVAECRTSTDSRSVNSTYARNPFVVRIYRWSGCQARRAVTSHGIYCDWSDPGAQRVALQRFFVALVAIHELIGPIAAKWTLDRAGETGQASPSRV